MIKWRGTVNGVETLGLGLEIGNINRLITGQPIVVRGKDLGIPFDIIIQFGTTPEEIIHDLRQVAELPPEREWKR